MNKVKQNKAITLIALVITIIILLILAGITINLVIGQEGIINIAQQAGKNFINAEEKEKQELENLYSSMMVATNDSSKITISMEDLNTLIDTKVEEKLQNSSVQPTGIKTDTYIIDTRTTTGAYATTMTGFSRATDPKNNISQYLSYSSTNGYTVLKSGWYYVYLYMNMRSSGASLDGQISFFVNGVCINRLYQWASNSLGNSNSDGFQIYLKEGDKFYFTGYGGNSGSRRDLEARTYPMF